MAWLSLPAPEGVVRGSPRADGSFVGQGQPTRVCIVSMRSSTRIIRVAVSGWPSAKPPYIQTQPGWPALSATCVHSQARSTPGVGFVTCLPCERRTAENRSGLFLIFCVSLFCPLFFFFQASLLSPRAAYLPP